MSYVGEVFVKTSGNVIIDPATSALQTTGNASLATIATNIPAKGQATMANSQPCVIASDQSPIAVYETDTIKATYSATANFSAPNLATDVFTITGSASKMVTVTAIYMSATQTTSGTMAVYLVKRSTANTAGTSTARTPTPYDSNDPAATATVLSYTANPTVGTLVGNLQVQHMSAMTAATANSDRLNIQLGSTIAKGIVLRGTSQVLAVNLNGVTYTGNSLYITVEFTEE